MTRGKGKDGLDFEASLKKLEAIVRRLEDEQSPLEESLRLFAEGKALARSCEAELAQAENQVRRLIEDDKGELKETALPEAEELPRVEPESIPTLDASNPPPNSARTGDDLPF